jgi:hypothetical protein
MYKYYIFIFILSYISCGYDQYFFEASPANPSEKIQSLLDGLGQEAITQSFLRNLQDTITLKSGFRIITEPNDICDQSGKLLNSGTKPLYCNELDVKITEIKKKGELILHHLFTNTNSDEILNYEKIVKLNIICDYTPLFVSANQFVLLQSPTTNFANNFNLYYGTSNKINRNIEIGRGIDSSNNADKAILLSWPIGNSNVVDGYQFSSRRLGWLILAQPLASTNPKDMLKIKVSGGRDDANTRVFAVFNNSNTVIECQYNKDEKYFYHNNIPINTDMKIICIASVNNTWELGKTNTTFDAQNSINVEMKPTTVQEINDSIYGL